jgi:hypothetical protein
MSSRFEVVEGFSAVPRLTAVIGATSLRQGPITFVSRPMRANPPKAAVIGSPG